MITQNNKNMSKEINIFRKKQEENNIHKPRTCKDKGLKETEELTIQKEDKIRICLKRNRKEFYLLKSKHSFWS